MTDQDTLHIFMTLAERLHFRQTSERHHMTPSNLTRMIQKLEETVGTALFERTKRTVSLTDSGRRFYEFAKATVASYEQFQSEIKTETPDQLRGTIRIYSTVTAAYSILPGLVKSFRNRYPLVTTYLETGVAKSGDAALRKGTADFAIAILFKPMSDEFLSQSILKTPLVFVVPSASPTRSLTAIPLIFPEQGDLATIINHYLADQSIRIDIHSVVEGHEAILAMVAAGLGGAILPQAVLDHSHLRGSVRVQPLAAPLPILEVGMVVRRAALHSEVKKAFWAFLET